MNGQSEDGVATALDLKVAEEIKVVLRVRPLNERETNPAFIKPSVGLRSWKVLEAHNSITQTSSDGVPLPDKALGRTIFTYDKVFGEESKTSEVYEYAARDIVENAVKGRNGSIFAYGQTSSGKTHTMQGSSSISASKSEGFVHMVARDLFHQIAKTQDREFEINVSVIEVYNEEVRDLLKNSKNSLLKIFEDPKRGVFVKAEKKKAASLSKLLAILSMGEKSRIVAKTALNKRSSRSHLIFCIMIDSSPPMDSRRSPAEDTLTQHSVFNLIDLAGSESVKHRSQHTNEIRKKEGGNINKSLLTLSRVITALGQPSKSQSIRHIGYRDSKLTRVLQPSLSGNAKLAFICCATTSGLYVEETKSTLQFAQRIKHVKTAPKINFSQNKNEIIKRLTEELEETKECLKQSEKKVNTLVDENEQLRLKINKISAERDRAIDKVEIYARSKKRQENLTKMKENVGQATGEMMALNDANEDLKEQVGFLSTIVDKLQGNKTGDEIESYINGMPANIRTDSQKSGIVSAITQPSSYGSHIDDDYFEMSSHLSDGMLSEAPSRAQSSATSLLSQEKELDFLVSSPNVISEYG